MSSKVKTKYFHGIGRFLEKELPYTDKYIRDVLNGLHEGRDTKAVREIVKRADELMSKMAS